MTNVGLHRKEAVPGKISPSDILTGQDFHSSGSPNSTRLRYFAPPADLRLHIGCIYLVTTDTDHATGMMRADFPQLRFMLSGSGHYIFANTLTYATPMVCMLGPTMGATRFLLDGPLQMLGVALLPLGWIALTGRDASDHIDRLYDMTASADGAAYKEILGRLKAMNEPEKAVTLLWDYLRANMAAVRPAIRAFVAAVDDWLASETSPQVRDLRDATGLSERQVARLTNRLYGAPPQYLARKYRALRFAAQIARDGQDRNGLCYDSFYDQSHSIREIKQFLGRTPGQIRKLPMATQMPDGPVQEATLPPFCA
ncbi:helix-turn-helix domain-containing protein [Sphingobium sp. EM0848]|uniref:helix-turn-helix domain-containing protein n=1 Tax=Sphingobium sp. EM0848 TaxID=2743473 RepID=UPI00159BF58E|nr:helix-turn-helix domain-containing protein [Sphingobium sp. EM0848]